jgi:hypothetical protein
MRDDPVYHHPVMIGLDLFFIVAALLIGMLGFFELSHLRRRVKAPASAPPQSAPAQPAPDAAEPAASGQES